mgnify:CR=1 FL=1
MALLKSVNGHEGVDGVNLPHSISGFTDSARRKNMHANRRKALLLLLSAIFSIAVLACGTGGSGSGDFQQVKTFEKVLTFDDFTAIGFKPSKEYDVDGLTDALEARKGFWGVDPYKRAQYEVRFYPSHEIALASGAAFAIAGTGDEFEATRREQAWDVGVKDRWQARGVTDTSSPGSVQAPGPTYGDYAIFGNVIMLCEGLNNEQSLEKCEALVDALATAGA